MDVYNTFVYADDEESVKLKRVLSKLDSHCSPKTNFYTIRKHGINFYCYADDTQLHLPTKPDEIVQIPKIKVCLKDVKSRMPNNFLFR